MKTLPITVLVHEGPTARAYLTRLRQAGFRPDTILFLVLKRHPATNKVVAPWLPIIMRQWYTLKTQETSLNYWPHFFRRNNPDLFETMQEALEELYPGSTDVLREISSPFQYEEYASHTQKIFVDDLRDEELKRVLKEVKYKTILFTGGGIIPAPLFSVPGIRFLHIHPGKLPAVRGADGTLWSILVRGVPSVSCFYMELGLDTGAVIKTIDLPLPHFKLRGGERPTDDILYKALFSYYDPLLRADFLIKILANTREDDSLEALPVFEQKEDEGITYHFMHNRLRSEALRKLFIS